MINILLLHGKGETSKSGFLPWLKSQLESKNYIVNVPDMPNPEAPVDTEQTKYVLEKCHINENTVVVGHSFGGIVALRLLEQGQKLKKLMLLATPATDHFLDGIERPTVSDALKKGFDYNKIKVNCPEFVLLYDETDYVVPTSDALLFAENLGAKPKYVKAVGHHFSSEQEPEILKYLEV